jgi:predicted dehydrogenase
MSMDSDSGSRLRVGFIGAGWTERVQIPTFLLAGLAAQAISSGREENARRVAAKFAIPEVHTDWRDLIQSDTVDLVSIVTPPHLHCEIAIAALRAGKHVICEKPTALNVAEAENMFAAAQAAPNQLAIIDHELRFHPQRAHMRRLLREGYIGSPLYIDLDWRNSNRLDPHASWSWHSDADKGGGFLGALGSHLLDLARWLLGRIDALSAQLQTAHFLRPEPDATAQHRVTADDLVHLMLQFGSGIQGRITASALYPDNLGMSVLLVGTEGALRVDYQDRLWGLRSPTYPKATWQEIQPPGPTVDPDALPNASPFTLGSYYLGRALAEAHQQGRPLALPDAASFYDGLVVQRALDAARKSHRDKVWVRL